MAWYQVGRLPNLTRLLGIYESAAGHPYLVTPLPAQNKILQYIQDESRSRRNNEPLYMSKFKLQVVSTLAVYSVHDTVANIIVERQRVSRVVSITCMAMKSYTEI